MFIVAGSAEDLINFYTLLCFKTNTNLLIVAGFLQHKLPFRKLRVQPQVYFCSNNRVTNFKLVTITVSSLLHIWFCSKQLKMPWGNPAYLMYQNARNYLNHYLFY